MRAAAVGVALDHLRQERPLGAGEDAALAELCTTEQDLELKYLKDRYREEFASAFQEAMGNISLRERTLLKLRYLDGLNADEIGNLFRVHRTTVTRWVDKTQRVLFSATRRAIAKKLGLTRSEFDSLIKVLQSDLEVVIESLLRQSQPKVP
jgi:RNA polymerase sigma-70 factor, ECF subfamily